MKLPKIKAEVLLTVGTMALGVAQMVLSNKKEANDRNVMKAEILDEVLKNLPEKKD